MSSVSLWQRQTRGKIILGRSHSIFWNIVAICKEIWTAGCSQAPIQLARLSPLVYFLWGEGKRTHWVESAARHMFVLWVHKLCPLLGPSSRFGIITKLALYMNGYFTIHEGGQFVLWHTIKLFSSVTGNRQHALTPVPLDWGPKSFLPVNSHHYSTKGEGDGG